MYQYMYTGTALRDRRQLTPPKSHGTAVRYSHTKRFTISLSLSSLLGVLAQCLRSYQ